MYKKEKTVIFVKKEFLFPDFWIFKKFNELYWNFNSNITIPRVIKKYRNKKLIILSDYENKIKLEERGVKTKTMGDYVGGHGTAYTDAKKLLKKWFGFYKLKKVFEYNSLDIGYIAEEEFSWWLTDKILDKINLVKKILEKEKPDRIIIANKRNLFWRCCKISAESLGIKVDVYTLNLIDYFGYFISKTIKKYSLMAKFHKIPLITRREFVRTKKKNEIESLIGKRENILILGLDRLYYSRVANVVEELKKSKKMQAIMLTTQAPMQEELKKKGYKFVSFGDFLNKEVKENVEKKAKEIWIGWKKVKNDKEFRKMFYYKKIDLWPAIDDELSYLFSSKFKWILYYIETTKKLLDGLRIKCVASIDDFIMPTRAVVVVAKSKSIPSLVVQQGLLGMPEGKYMVPLTANKMAVWGIINKKQFRELGIKSKKLVVTGNPFHDTQKTKISKARKKELLDKLGLDKNKGTIILATQAYEGEFAEKEREKIMELVIGSINKIKDKQLILKLHPRDKEETHKAILKKFKPKNVVMIKKEYSIEELMNIADALITVNSTVIFDAAISGKPVIIMDVMNRQDPALIGLEKTGAFVKVSNEKDLHRALRLINDKEFRKKLEGRRKRFIRHYLYKVDGKASKRISNLIEKMIKEKR